MTDAEMKVLVETLNAVTDAVKGVDARFDKLEADVKNWVREYVRVALENHADSKHGVLAELVHGMVKHELAHFKVSQNKASDLATNGDVVTSGVKDWWAKALKSIDLEKILLEIAQKDIGFNMEVGKLKTPEAVRALSGEHPEVSMAYNATIQSAMTPEQWQNPQIQEAIFQEMSDLRHKVERLEGQLTQEEKTRAYWERYARAEVAKNAETERRELAGREAAIELGKEKQRLQGKVINLEGVVTLREMTIKEVSKRCDTLQKENDELRDAAHQQWSNPLEGVDD